MQLSEAAAVRRCSVKKMFLNIMQNSQENNCATVCFLIKLQASAKVSFLIELQAQAGNFSKKETLAQVFSGKFCIIFKNTLFYSTPVAASELCISNYSIRLRVSFLSA